MTWGCKLRTISLSIKKVGSLASEDWRKKTDWREIKDIKLGRT